MIRSRPDEARRETTDKTILTLTRARFKGIHWLSPLLGVALFVAYGCASSGPEQRSPTTPPPEQESAEQGSAERASGEQPAQPERRQPPGHQADTAEEEQPVPPPAAPAPKETPAEQQAATVSEMEVEAFADVQIQLSRLQQQFAQRAQEGAEASEIEDQFQQQAVQIVQASELDTQRFNEIAVLVQRDPDLRRRVQAALEKRVGE